MQSKILMDVTSVLGNNPGQTNPGQTKPRQTYPGQDKTWTSQNLDRTKHRHGQNLDRTKLRQGKT